MDNTVETSDPSLRISAGRPRVIDLLLTLGRQPRLGSSAIQREPIRVDGDSARVLAEHLVDEERALPVVAITCASGGFTPETEQVAEQLARRLTGLGAVTLLDPGAQDVLKASLPEGLAVWGGAIRVYAPAPMVSADAWRHRFFTADKFPRAWDQVVNWVFAQTTRRRIPDLLRSVERSTATEDLATMQQVIKSLEERLEQAEFELEMEQDERARLDQHLNRVLGHNERMRAAGFELGRGDEVFALASPSDEQAPDDAQTVSDPDPRVVGFWGCGGCRGGRVGARSCGGRAGWSPVAAWGGGSGLGGSFGWWAGGGGSVSAAGIG